jgi:hypothetical protein
MAADRNVAANARNLFTENPVFAAQWNFNPKPRHQVSQAQCGAKFYRMAAPGDEANCATQSGTVAVDR